MKKIFTIAIIASIAFSACNKSVQLTKRITAKWKFTKWEKTMKSNNQITQTITIENKGSLELKEDGTGTYVQPGSGVDISYPITEWLNSEDVVMIQIKDGLGNEYPMVFDVTTNEKKTQVWTYTDTKVVPGGGTNEDKIVISATKE